MKFYKCFCVFAIFNQSLAGQWINPSNVNDSRFDAKTGQLKASHSNITSLVMKNFKIPSERATLFDRKGIVLAQDVKKEILSVWLEGGDISKVKKVFLDDLVIIEKKLNVDLSFYKNVDIKVLEERRGTPLSLKIKLNQDQIEAIKTENLPRIRVIENFERNYSKNLEVSHAVGWIDESNPFSTTAIGFERRPKSGLEVLLNNQIQSRSFLTVIRDVSDFSLKIINEEFERPKENIHTSLDVDLQKKVAKLFLNKFKKGVVLLGDAMTGEMLVMLSLPVFDPDYLKSNAQNSKAYENTKNEALSNRIYRPYVLESYDYIANSLKFSEDMSYFESEAEKNYREIMGNPKFTLSKSNKTPLFLMCLLQALGMGRKITFRISARGIEEKDVPSFWRFMDFTTVVQRLDSKDKESGIAYMGQIAENDYNLILISEDKNTTDKNLVDLKDQIEALLTK